MSNNVGSVGHASFVHQSSFPSESSNIRACVSTAPLASKLTRSHRLGSPASVCVLSDVLFRTLRKSSSSFWVYSFPSSFLDYQNPTRTGSPEGGTDGHATSTFVRSRETPSSSSISQVNKPDPGDALFGQLGLTHFSQRVPSGKHLTRPAPQWLPALLLASHVWKHVCFFWHVAVLEHQSSALGTALLLMSKLLKCSCFVWHFAVWEHVPFLCSAPYHDMTLHFRLDGHGCVEDVSSLFV